MTVCEWLKWSLFVTVGLLRSAPFLSVRLFFPCLRFTGIRNQKAVEDLFETYRRHRVSSNWYSHSFNDWISDSNLQRNCCY